MSNTLLLGLSLCSMVARVFPTEDSVQTNGTKRPMETIVIQREVDWGNADSRIANVESEMKRVEAGMADVESEVKAGIADLKSLISKLVGSGNGGNASQLVGGSKETGSKGDNGNQDKDNVAATKRDCTNAENCFSVFTVKKTWDDARRSCQAMGEDLATLNSLAETRSLQKYLQQTTYRGKPKGNALWIGSKKGKTKMGPGHWKWITGEPIPIDGTVGKWERYHATLSEAGCLIIHDQADHDICRHGCGEDLFYVCSKKK